MASSILLLISLMPRRLVARISLAGPRAQKAAAVRGRAGFCLLRRSQAFPPAGQVSHGRRGQHPRGKTAEALRGLPLAGRAVVAYRIWERPTLEGQTLVRWTWGHRIWLAWDRSGGHREQQDHSAFPRCAAGQSDKERANDWPHRRMEVSAYDPEHALAHDRESIVPSWGHRARARPEGRAAGTAGFPG